ncbi:MAG: patatin-like phospholipase family protein [Spirochaetales bacterium]|nr:patatin-like phospholipase family protein [Spirochaetales bacterium]
MPSNKIVERVEPLKVGLVLSGGAALGFAHIGVLRVIEELGIPIDLVVGNSMGALVGGLYAAGYSPEDMIRFSERLNWNMMFMELNRSSTGTVFDGAQDLLTLNLDDTGFLQDEGIVDDQRICSLLSRLTYRVSMIRNFDDLEVPFRTVAVDLNRGGEVKIKDGVLAEAMRASMGLPVVFNPIKAYGGYLIDGGVLNNLPVDIALSEDMDIIISVNVEYLPERENGDMKNAINVADQTMRIVFNINSHMEDVKLADLTIVPDLEDFTRFDFNNFSELADRGEAAARSHWDDLVTLASVVGKTRKLEPKDSFRYGSYFDLPEPEINNIVFKDNSDLNNHSEENPDGSILKINSKKLNLDAVERYIVDFNNLGDYRSLIYYLDETTLSGGEGGTLNVKGTPSELGQNELVMGVHFDAELGDEYYIQGDGYFELKLRDLTGNNSMLNADLSLYFDKGIDFEVSYYQPLLPSLGLRQKLDGLFYISKVNSYQTTRELDDYQNLSANLELVYDLMAIAQISFGYEAGVDWYKSLGTLDEISNNDAEEINMLDFYQTIKLGFDWALYNNSSFSKFGFDGNGSVSVFLPFDFDDAFFRSIEVYGRLLYSYQTDKIVYLNLDLGHYKGEVQNQWTTYSPGGPGGIPGYISLGEEGNDKIILGVGYRMNIEKITDFLGMETSLDTVFRIGNSWDDLDSFDELGILKAGLGAGLIVQTPIGKVSADLGFSWDGSLASGFRFNSEY